LFLCGCHLGGTEFGSASEQGDGTGSGSFEGGPPSAAEEQLNAVVRAAYPSGRAARMPSPDSSGGSGGASSGGGTSGVAAPAVLPGQTVSVSPPPSSTGEPADEVCVAFGSPDDGWCVPVEDTNGGALDIPIPVDFCEGINISDVCHDIRCYESATVGGQTFTSTSVQPLIAACGGCDEPSCAPLIESGVCECATDDDCQGGKVCDGGVCVTDGALRISARWDTSLDIDLHVLDPGGEELSFRNTRLSSGGVLDNDDRQGGPGTVENAVWEDTPPNGTYTYWVVNFRGGDAGSIRLTVSEDGVQQTTQTVTVGSESGAESTRFMHSF
jgi:hypothetical protein